MKKPTTVIQNGVEIKTSNVVIEGTRFRKEVYTDNGIKKIAYETEQGFRTVYALDAQTGAWYVESAC